MRRNSALFCGIVTATRGLHSGPVESVLLIRQRAEHAVEKEKADAEIAVHRTAVIKRVVMNIVKPAGGDEPCLKEPVFLHPEFADVHAVVKVTEHESRPSESNRNE